MELFDALPAVVRHAIAFAGYPFHPRVAARLLRRGLPADRVAAVIIATDRRIARLRGAA